MLKKFLALSLVLGSIAFTASTAEAKTASEKAVGSVELNNSAAPQWQRNRRWDNRRNNRRTVRTVVRTVRRNRAIYRETYRVVTNRNGRTTTTLISRVRIR